MTNFCLRLPTVRGISAAGVTVKLEPKRSGRREKKLVTANRIRPLTQNEAQIGVFSVTKRLFQFVMRKIFAEMNDRIFQLAFAIWFIASTARVMIHSANRRIEITQIFRPTFGTFFQIHVAVQFR